MDNDERNSDDSLGCLFLLMICVIVSFMLLYKPIGAIDLSIIFGNIKYLYQYPIIILALIVQVLGGAFVIFIVSSVVNWIVQLSQIGAKASFIIHSNDVSREYDYVDYMMDRTS